MTTLEALVSVSQTLLRANGRWCVNGIDETLRNDIRATVFDAAKLFRDVGGEEAALIGMAISELERRAASAAVLERRSEDPRFDPEYNPPARLNGR